VFGSARRRIAAASAGVVIAAILALVGSAGAQADTFTNTRPASPGSMYRWGMAWAGLTAQATIPAQATSGFGSDYGGWYNWNSVVFDGAMTSSGCAAATVVTPSTITLGEPYATAGGQLGVPIYMRQVNDSRSGRLSGVYQIGPRNLNGDDACTGSAYKSGVGLVCAKSAWSLSKDQTTYPASVGLLSGTAYGPQTLSVAFGQGGTWFATNCPYVVSLELYINGIEYSNTTLTGDDMFWSAENWYDKAPYPPQSTYDKQMCNGTQGAAVSALDCVWTGLGSVGENADLSFMCDGAPAASWSSFDWIGPTIDFYSKCLWQPFPNWWDRSGAIATAWNNGPMGSVNTTIDSVVQSYQVTGGCGVLFSVPSGSLLQGFSVDTCAWNSWAAPVKVALGIWVGIWAATWIIQFVISTIIGVVNRRTPTPVGDPET
jgi:hypothetical protein